MKRRAGCRFWPHHNARQRNETRRAAHVAVSDAITRGLLIPGPCEVCGVKRTEGHHDDYLKVLQVRWLCRRHHRAWHKAHPGEIPNAAVARSKRRSFISIEQAFPFVENTTASLRALCVESKVSDRQLARSIGCSRQHLSNLFGGGFRTLKSVAAVANALGYAPRVSFDRPVAS